jgi:hypothetical protein
MDDVAPRHHEKVEHKGESWSVRAKRTAWSEDRERA